MKVRVTGGGLAGSEVALSLAGMGIEVELYEMRPSASTGVHQSGSFAELVCSNSLKSESLDNASGLLKEEGIKLGSKLLEIAHRHRVPAGKALAVDRVGFSREVTDLIESTPLIEIRREEVSSLDLQRGVNVVCTGPLTSPKLESFLGQLFGEHLFFFDAVSPIIEAGSIDFERGFFADRYSEEGDYLNCPLDGEEYGDFWRELVEAELAKMENFSDRYLFERCQPVEEIARSGFDALRFGPMKPVGLIDPSSGKEPFAVVQLRKENSSGSLMGLVGFQTRLQWGEQKRVFSMIPALRNSQFVRYGVMHRNTYLNSPILLDKNLGSKEYGGLFFAGQITGLEGYVEAIVSGRVAALNVERYLRGVGALPIPVTTMIGGLIEHVTVSGRSPLKPVYSNFGLLPPVAGRGKRDRNREKVSRARDDMDFFLKEWRSDRNDTEE
ncbi:MAG TPA: methylenetetrahydrofolate--tRNA-(uracil(54)-C(5))-methyltransferase (FADH(2)-oxidizing) TrmFO [Mesotoga sp.]|jgi:methylenetetrahydrofolate--tRNA-(uracil-5-)-methyltransferase|nr:methylenetetrahydrofolate--tRNA-(uracil(54)-C(5))-methyltransferase (FADH(2)-oxidizing) TrmFO [Mesotoga sp.]MDI9376106.1 methylenetetrahydrofolate--tRNA-(uracil(54)-C(5))-methyltransferase (FADH(2)-oxidizing) TrmFO [Thermotogota bacterium]NLX33878.1 methylenetetrahydrofolate--tRNA-(uracil(54)-C(5))-methyltransferase (FADH(2)-oxidizing) TrmFO [Thermotogaceae bacterium]MDD4040315.1 methylenetetrahydrofolate--tRNA-(uracil(54)-C(5))-methyltransferase (FADH(2)-oxidizing) TrmFO [Mesotoga sp.]MDD44